MTDQQGLDDVEMRAWRGYVEASALIGYLLDRQLQADAGMPHAYYAVLVRLAEASGGLRMTDLAEQLRVTRSRLSRTVDKLEQAGWVERHDDPADARGRAVALTAAGARLLESAAPGHVGAVRGAVFDHLSREQVEQLADICAAITTGITGSEDAAGPRDLPWLRR